MAEPPSTTGQEVPHALGQGVAGIVQTDHALLAEYRAAKSTEAFAQIVNRHGAMVFHTCLRVLGHRQDAEDATQAVFLLLAWKPAVVKITLGGWLHKVARDTAIEVLRSRSSRARREERTAEMRTAARTDHDSALREELDAALGRLPARLREAVVLRYLEGRAQDEAARQAGCPPGTIAWRAAEGLNRLRAILGRRGTVVPPAILTAFLAHQASAGLPGTLVPHLTCSSLIATAAGAPVGLLAHATLKALAWAKVKFWTAVSATLLATATGGTIIVRALAPAPAPPPPSWTAAVERGTLRGHTTNLTSVAFSPDGQLVATTSEDGTTRLWDVATYQERARLKARTGRVHRVSFSRDGQTLVTQNDGSTVQLWEVATGREIAAFPASAGMVHTVVFSPDGALLATADLNGVVKLWDAATRNEVATLRGHTAAVTPGASFSPDGALLATGSYDKTVRLWDVARRQERMTLRGHSETVPWVAFSPDGTRLASAGWDKTVKIWDVAAGTELVTLRHTDKVGAVAFSPDRKVLASASWDRTVKLWDATTWKELATLKGVGGPVTFSADGQTLAAGGADYTVKLWVKGRE